jgi:hypothetical protein
MTFALTLALFCQPSRAQDIVNLEKEIVSIENELQTIKTTDGDALQLRKRRLELEEKKAILEKRHEFISKYPDKGAVVDGFELAKDAYTYTLRLLGWSNDELHNLRLQRAVREEMEGRLVRVEGIYIRTGSEIISRKHLFWQTGCSGDPNLVYAKSVAQSRYLDVIFKISSEDALRRRDVALLLQRSRPDNCWKFEDVKEGIKLPEYTVTIEGVVKEWRADELKLVDWVLVGPG